MTDARAQTDPQRRLAGLITGYVEVVLDEHDSMGILVSEEERLDPTYRPRIVERKRAYADFLSDCIAEVLGGQGRDTHIDPTVAAYGVLGQVYGVVTWYLVEGQLSEDELIQQVRDVALHGLVDAP